MRFRISSSSSGVWSETQRLTVAVGEDGASPMRRSSSWKSALMQAES